MFRIFRTVRQKLLVQNRLTRYFAYALGEIVLVVIGILIALQVNNWNNRRIEQHRVHAYARSLVQDLRSDIEMPEAEFRE